MAGNKAVDPSLGNQAALNSSNQGVQLAILIVAMFLSVIVGYCIRGRRSRNAAAAAPAALNENVVPFEDQSTRKKFVDEHLSSTEWTSSSGSSSEKDEGTVENGDEEQGATSAPECPVCLAPFENGDKIASSSNPECPHIFHHDCVYKWLLKKKECPMCRSTFLKEEHEDEGQGYTFVSTLENASAFPRDATSTAVELEASA